MNRCIDIAKSFGVRKLILFGSALETPETAVDLDVACEGLRGWDLFRFARGAGEVVS